VDEAVISTQDALHWNLESVGEKGFSVAFLSSISLFLLIYLGFFS
jgi:hypothetical protein